MYLFNGSELFVFEMLVFPEVINLPTIVDGNFSFKRIVLSSTNKINLQIKLGLLCRGISKNSPLRIECIIVMMS